MTQVLSPFPRCNLNLRASTKIIIYGRKMSIDGWEMIEVRLSKVRVEAQVHQNLSEQFKAGRYVNTINFVSEVIISKIRENKEGLILNGLNQVLAYADDVYSETVNIKIL